MTFLQPLLLYGLPMVLVPVIIHLLNKRRHRTLPWAATMFLVRATQQSRGRRKLKHFLILACRVLAIGALVFALSRPLAGGWVSWLGGNRPEVILVLFDRSASMETAPAETAPSKRQNAVDRLAGAVRQFASGSRLVVFDNASAEPVELASADALAELPQTGPSNTAADVPALLERALDYLATAKPGRAEIWIASDLQASNWMANDGRWQTIRTSYLRLGQDPPVRILGLTEAPAGEHSLRLTGLFRQGDGVVVDLEIRRHGNAPGAVPLTLSLAGSSATQETVNATQPILSLRKHIRIDDRKAGGWGSLSLGPDLSPADNTLWFSFAPVRPVACAVVSDEPAGRILALACAPPGVPDRTATVLAPAEAHRIDWASTQLVVWQAAPPTGPVAGQLESFVEGGGSLLLLPAGQPTGDAAAPLLGVAWAAPEAAPPDGRFKIVSWERTGNPLEDFRDGQPMALDRLFVIKRRQASGEATVLAAYEDGIPAVMRVVRGRGQALFLTTLPDRRWSDLGSYNDLLPLVERLAQAAARFNQNAPNLSCGEALPEVAGTSTAWEALDGSAGTRSLPSVHAGIYRRGEVLAALNTPAAEFEAGRLDPDTLAGLCGGMRMRFFEERVTREQGLATEIWRSFAIAMLLLLLSEALLSLPPRPRSPAPNTAASPAP